ncbi:MAG: Ig-like domain-containing protein [Anaerolineae bacterium]|nr:Ig-like domain-containing protein [Anaerolineae bacterium]
MSKRMLHILFSIFVIIGLLACTLPRPKTEMVAPTATLSAQSKATAIQPPTATAGPTSTPTASPTPSPSPTPLPPTAPLLLYRQPDRGEELKVDSALVLTFDQAMDRASVEQAFGIDPQVSGSFEWAADRILIFEPEKPWEREAVYRVSIDTTAKSLEGIEMRQDVAFRFSTTGYLEVTQVQPADGTEQVAMDGTITVMFNRPVVPLVAVADLENLPEPLWLDPPLDGQGEWLNTSIYVWTPSDGFAPSTTYQVTVQAGLEDTTGGVLAEDYTWSFTTQLPRIVWAYPRDSGQFIAPASVISATFNQPMDATSVERAFSLTYGKQNDVPGTFSWSEDKKTFTFAPNDVLPRNVTFQARVDEGALGATGSKGMAKSFIWSFTTVDYPRIVSISPADGSLDVRPFGSVYVDFSSPIDKNTLPDNLTIQYYDPGKQESGIITATSVYSYWSNYDTELAINFGMRASSRYTVTIGDGLAGKYGEPIQTGAVSRFTTRELDPSCYLAMPGQVGTFNAYATTAVIVGYRNVSRLDFTLYQLDAAKFFQFLGSNAYNVWNNLDTGTLEQINQWSVSVAPPQNETQVYRFAVKDAADNSPAPGLYYLQVKSPQIDYDNRRPSGYLLSISRTGVIVKRTRGSAMAWVTDLKSGQPVTGADVSYFAETTRLGNDTTDQDGISTITFAERDMWSPILVLVQREGDVAVSSTYWTDGISPWEFGISSEYYQDPYKGQFYTDRPIYRPGQTVYFKGVIRQDDDVQYALPQAGGTVYVTIEDGQGREIYKEELPLSDMGTVHGELTLDEEASLGSYYISAVYQDGYFGTSFRVAEYKKPEYQVDVETDLDQYVQGDTINATAHATYYFGGPVSNAQVRWVVLSQDYTFEWSGPGRYYWNEWTWVPYWERGDDFYAGYGKLIAEGKGETDADGRFTFAVPADIADKINSQVYTLEATVTDVNNQEVSNRTQSVVHKGLFYIGLSPRRYVGKVGEEQTVDVKLIDIEQAPVAEQDVDIVFLKRRWYSTQKEGADGRWYWDWEVEEIPVYTTTVRTDGEGTAIATWEPEEGGSYKVRALAFDKRENKIVSAAYMWVSSSTWVSWRRENNDRIELIADKDEYEVGDVAEILVSSPFQGDVKALVTIERGDIIEHRLVTLASNSEIIEVPIEEEYVPNVFISVALVKGMDETNPVPAFKLGYIALPVSTKTKTLNIALTPDRDMEQGEYYRPRETVKYDVQVTDHTGQGVETELSLDLVDLAVLALTGGDRGRSLLDSFYYQRGVGIQTSGSLVVNIDRVAEELPLQEGKGGGGGGDAGEGLVRTNFADTAYWNPMVRTDADGHATVEVALPDNLTTWRLRGRGVTADTLLGESTTDVMSTLDLLVRTVAPRFFVIGDKATLSVIVHNNTGESLDATATLQAAGLDMDAGPQSVSIPAKGQVKIDWNVTVQNVEQIVLRASVDAGQYADAVEITLPVYTYSTPEVVATAGQLESADERLEAVILPQTLDPTQGELTIQVDPSLAAGMRDGLEYLQHYPYECIEQTVSRWLPNVLTYKALKDLGIENAELEEKLPGLVSEGLQRIYTRQHYDGSWGWWQYSKGDPFITAYVLLGLVKAEQSDFVVDEGVTDSAIKYLRQQFKTPSSIAFGYQFNQQAFILYALAEAGAGDLSRSVRLFEDRDKLSNYGKAYLAMALGIVDVPDSGLGTGKADGSNSRRIKALLSDLSSAAILSATGAHWEEKWVDYWTMNTDTRTTAVIIDAFAKLAPDNSILPNAVRWLMVARRAGHWETTQETAWSLIALTDYMVMTGELEADYSYMIALNGKAIEQRDVTQDDVDASYKILVPIADLLEQTVNQVWVARHEPAPDQTGQGRLYYAMYLRYFVPVTEVKALSRGIIIARQYLPTNCEDQASCPPVQNAQVGDVIRVKITLVAPHDLHFMVLEDPLPAGMEAVDRSLKTTSVVTQDPTLENQTYRRGWGYDGWGWWWFNHSEVRDEKVALFADLLPRGTYEYTYLIRASVPGEFLTMPTLAYEMYFPEVWGRSDGGKFTIGE